MAKRKAGEVTQLPWTASPPADADLSAVIDLVAQVQTELAAAGRLDTYLGQGALVLARKMGNTFDTGSATAAVHRELRATMAEALVDAKTESELERARARVRRSG
jgi:hypothetical protein